MSRFRIHRVVAAEFEEVSAWYAGISPLVQENFVEAFHLALVKVRRQPTAHALWRPPFRRIRLTRYPYMVIYYSHQRMTSVLALVHERREPVRVAAMLTRRVGDFH